MFNCYHRSREDTPKRSSQSPRALSHQHTKSDPSFPPSSTSHPSDWLITHPPHPFHRIILITSLEAATLPTPPMLPLIRMGLPLQPLPHIRHIIDIFTRGPIQRRIRICPRALRAIRIRLSRNRIDRVGLIGLGWWCGTGVERLSVEFGLAVVANVGADLVVLWRG